MVSSFDILSWLFKLTPRLLLKSKDKKIYVYEDKPRLEMKAKGQNNSYS